MKSFLVFLAVLGPTARAPETITIPSLGSRFKQTDERIAELYQFRDNGYPHIEPEHNPFRLVGVAPTPDVPTAAKADEPPPADTDAAVLRLGLATLKVNGIVMIGGRAFLTINQGTYKEGDVLLVRVHGRPFYFRIRQIKSNSVVMTLNDEEMVLQF